MDTRIKNTNGNTGTMGTKDSKGGAKVTIGKTTRHYTASQLRQFIRPA